MTLLELADHFSGLPRDLLPNTTVGSSDDVYAHAAMCESSSCRHEVPGHSFLYSNYAFDVLAPLSERCQLKGLE
jgi:CubicO group peptidase (beta-lactamase class C family)